MGGHHESAGTPAAVFGDSLRRHRRSAGLSQEELAERAALSPRGLRYLEQGTRAPYPQTADRLVVALGLTEGDAAAFISAARAVRAKTGVGLAGMPAHEDLIGREEDLAQAMELVRASCRLLTVLGAGGVGKTRFAIELAQELSPDFLDGVAWVSLAGLTAAEDVAPAVLAALRRPPGSGRSEPESVLALLRRRNLLLVLDNFEQVASAAPLAGRIVANCPTVVVLATSRTPLRLAAEREFMLEPLPVPDSEESTTLEAVESSPAVQLFCQRARRVDRSFGLDEGNAADVAELCRRLDGLPLALELAAPRIRVLPPGGLVAELSGGLDLLTGGPCDVPERQRSLRATLDWSYQLLDPTARLLLRSMSVFVGGCTFAALRTVFPATRDSSANLIDAVDVLQRSSLVHRADPPGGDARYALLETVRQYAREQLRAAGETAEASRRHAAYFTSLGLEAARRLEGPGQADAVHLLEEEHDNLRAALQWLLGADTSTGLHLAGELWMFWYLRGYFGEGRRQLSNLLDATSTSARREARAKALLGAGQLARAQQDYATARVLMQESVAVYRQLDDPLGTAFALFGAGFVADMQERYEDARLYFQEALDLAAQAHSPYPAALALHHLGLLALELDGDLPRAHKLLQQSLDRFRLVGFPRHVALVLSTLGNVACRESRLNDASQLHTEALTLLQASGQSIDLHWVLEGFAELAAAHGEHAHAVSLAAAAQRQREALGEAEWDLIRRNREVRLHAAQRILGEEGYRQAWAAGQSLTPEEAAALVLARAPAAQE